MDIVFKTLKTYTISDDYQVKIFGTREVLAYLRIYRQEGKPVKYGQADLKLRRIRQILSNFTGVVYHLRGSGFDSVYFLENGFLHRDGGPAASQNGDDILQWYKHGVFHRDDGPAGISTWDDEPAYALNGEVIELETFLEKQKNGPYWEKIMGNMLGSKKDG